MIITIAMAKGGVGKTATASILAQAAAYSGRKCLAVDADSQGNFTYTLDAETGPGTYNIITNRPAEIQHTAQNIDVLPASWDLATLTTKTGSARRLRTRLERIRNEYDYIIIDTPTAAGELQLNGITAADMIVLPMDADAYNIIALRQILDIIKRIRPDVPAGIVLTKFDGRAQHSRQLKETIINQAAARGVSFYGQVRKCIAVQEAATLQESLFEYAPKCTAAADYMEIWHKIENSQ